MVERILRGVAGTLVVVSVALSQMHSKWWLVFTVIVGANLFQSAFSNWCSLKTILLKLGVKGCDAPKEAAPTDVRSDSQP